MILTAIDWNILIGQYSGFSVAEIYLWKSKSQADFGMSVSELEKSIEGSRQAFLTYKECNKVYVNDVKVWDGTQDYLGHGTIKIDLEASKGRAAFLRRILS